LQDNGGAVGPLGGVCNKTNDVITGGAASPANSVTYTDVLPSLDVHCKLAPNWTAYAQLAAGDQIPSTSVFDIKDAKGSPAPSATKTKTLQVGTVWQSAQMSLAADVHHTKLGGSAPRPAEAGRPPRGSSKLAKPHLLEIGTHQACQPRANAQTVCAVSNSARSGRSVMRQ
jgi:hypothetical protein